MRNLKCRHETRKYDESNPEVPNDGTIVFRGMVDNDCVFEVPFQKDAKNKVRIFYRDYYKLMSGFFAHLEKKGLEYLNRETIIKKIHEYRENQFKKEMEKEQEEKELSMIGNKLADPSFIDDASTIYN